MKIVASLPYAKDAAISPYPEPKDLSMYAVPENL
jgi:hypothetical protein